MFEKRYKPLKERPLDIQGPVKRERAKLLSEFPFDLQRDIIQSISAPAGIREPHLVEPRKVRNYIDDSNMGYYNRKKNSEVLGINFKKLLEIEPDPEKRKLYFWRTFNHEQIHAATSSEDGDLVGYKTSGLIIFHLWNEGVTEKLARMVTRRMYDANGYRSVEVPKSYEIPVRFVELVINKMSESAGVSPKIVEEAIINGLFQNQGDIFLDGSMAEIFADILPPNLLEEIPHASYEYMEEALNGITPEVLEKKLGARDSIFYKMLWDNFLASLNRKIK